ncbi:MAG: hypothetical protein JWO80_2850 [Bryobacterales bacterium]|nr:hypothetical protein [Bryobacterales bacterium]
MASESLPVLASLKEHGLLLHIDANLPNVCALVAGAAVRGSWWAHPRGHEMFRVGCELAEHPDVLVTKLISGKITYLHRALWPAVIAIGRAREPWQIERLSSAARDLLADVDRNPIQTDRRVSKPASELEKNLLVHSEQLHTEVGAHARCLESWDHWSARTGSTGKQITAVHARLTLESVMGSLNQKFDGRGRLPWQR